MAVYVHSIKNSGHGGPGDGRMESNAEMISTYLCPEGVSLVDGEIDGYPVAFDGTVRGENGAERKAWGKIRWHTYAPGQLGKHSIAGENQRDACVLLITMENGSKWKQDLDGPQSAVAAALDYDFIKRLFDFDADAEEELVRIASQEVEHCDFHRRARG